jgi:hypothetical protein
LLRLRLGLGLDLFRLGLRFNLRCLGFRCFGLDRFVFGAAASAASGFASGAIEGASATFSIGSILGVSSLDMGAVPMDENSSIGNFQTLPAG